MDPDGFIKIPAGNGIGVRVVPAKLNKYKVFYDKIG
jgi:L-alanine-DL-glutamate epimerase-like enolase superfamily enzyme